MFQFQDRFFSFVENLSNQITVKEEQMEHNIFQCYLKVWIRNRKFLKSYICVFLQPISIQSYQQQNPMKINEKLLKYASFLSLSEKERSKRISKAKQKTQGKNPQGEHVFPEKNFIKFQVEEEDGNVIQLATFRYLPKEEPIAVVIMLHGLNSHINQGAHLAYEWAQQGFVTVGFDHRGFGQSEGKPGYVHSKEIHLQDCLQFIELIKQIYRELPFFCTGLSMGGMATYYLTLMYPEFFIGAIMMAPALKNNLGGFAVGLTKVLKKILPQNTKLAKPIYGMGSKYQGITEFVKQDPYAFKQRACLSTFHMLFDTMDKSGETFKDYSMPFVVVQGGLDKLVNPSVAFQLFEQSKTPIEDKQILFYDEMWHDVWHEEEIHEIMDKVIKWMLGRVQMEKKKEGKKRKIIHQEEVDHN